MGNARKEGETREEHRQRLKKEEQRRQEKMKPKMIKPMPPSQRRNKRLMQNRYESLINKYGKEAGVMKFMQQMGVGQEEE